METTEDPGKHMIVPETVEVGNSDSYFNLEFPPGLLSGDEYSQTGTCSTDPSIMFRDLEASSDISHWNAPIQSFNPTFIDRGNLPDPIQENPDPVQEEDPESQNGPMSLEAVLRTGRQVSNEYMLTPISSFYEAHCAKIIDDVFYKVTEEILYNIDHKFTKKIEKYSDLANGIPITNSDDVDWKQIWKKYPSIDETKAVLNLFNHPDLIMSKLKLICDYLPEVNGTFRFKLPFETDNALKLVSSTMSGYDQDYLCDLLWLNKLTKFKQFKYLLMFEKGGTFKTYKKRAADAKGVPARPLNKFLMFKSTFQKVVQELKICELVEGTTVESLRLTCDVAKLSAAIEGKTINEDHMRMISTVIWHSQSEEVKGLFKKASAMDATHHLTVFPGYLFKRCPTRQSMQ